MTDYNFLNASLNNDEGAYLVPSPLAKKLLDNINEYDESLSLFRKWPMTSLTEDIPILSTASSASWTSAEGQNKGNTQPAFSQITLTAKELAAVVVVTERLLMTANIENLMGVIQDDLARAFAKAKVQTYFGYADDGTFTYDLTNDTPNSVTYGTGADLLVDISNALQKVEEAGHRGPFAFVTHPAIRHQLRSLRDDNGLPVLNPATAGSPETLFGYPIKYSTFFEKVGSPAKYELFVADWSKVVEGQLSSLQMAKSRDATITLADTSTVNLFQKNMVAIKAWTYVAFTVSDLTAIAKVTGLG